MNTYQVLWIDDNAEEQDAFLESAYLEGLNINYYKTSKLGMEELTSKIEQYDAIILDAMVYNESEDEKAGLTGLLNSIKKINGLADRKSIPYFIFSGYIDKDEHSSAREMLADETIFIKSKDNQALFDAIKKAADGQEVTQLKHKYPNVFALCKDEYIGQKHFDRVLQLIKDIEYPENISNQQDALIPMRKILEDLFKKLNNLGLIPDEIQFGKGAINGASIFLAGINKSYNYKKELIHPVIAEAIRHVIGLTQDAAHSEGNKLRADMYLSTTSNTYLYQSLCFSFLEILDYLKPFIDDNSNKDINQSKWNEVVIIPSTTISLTGKVVKIAENGWGTFIPVDSTLERISIPPAMVTSNDLSLNQGIEITTEPSPCGTKTFIKTISKEI